LDIAFMCAHIRHRGLTFMPLFVDDLVAVVSKVDPLAQEPFVEARQLQDLVYITYSQVVEPDLDDDLFFRPARFAPAKVREVSTFNAILDLVAGGSGFSILSRWELDLHSDAADLVPLRLSPNGLKVAWSA